MRSCLLNFELKEPVYDFSGTEFMESHYVEILKYISKRIRNKQRAEMLVSDVYITIKNRELKQSWQPSEGYVDLTVWKILNMYCKYKKYWNDLCDDDSISEYRDHEELDDDTVDTNNNYDIINESITVKLIYNKYNKKDYFNSRIVIGCIELTECLLEVDRSIFKSLK